MSAIKSRTSRAERINIIATAVGSWNAVELSGTELDQIVAALYRKANTAAQQQRLDDFIAAHIVEMAP